jgi:hypothetical protein
VRAELPFELDEVDITGDPELEALHREWLPVVEIYHVPADALRRRLAR